MPTFDVSPYRLAATLAIDLVLEQPTLAVSEAVAIAWQTYQASGDAKFQSDRYADDVNHSIHEIKSGQADRVTPGPEIWAKAIELLKEFNTKE